MTLISVINISSRVVTLIDFGEISIRMATLFDSREISIRMTTLIDFKESSIRVATLMQFGPCRAQRGTPCNRSLKVPLELQRQFRARNEGFWVGFPLGLGRPSKLGNLALGQIRVPGFGCHRCFWD